MLPRSRPNGEAPGKRTPSDAREVHGVADLRESAAPRPSWLVFATSARAAPFFERQLLERANKPTEADVEVAQGIHPGPLGSCIFSPTTYSARPMTISLPGIGSRPWTTRSKRSAFFQKASQFRLIMPHAVRRSHVACRVPSEAAYFCSICATTLRSLPLAASGLCIGCSDPRDRRCSV
jgi:hypothetical protein